MRSLAAGSTMLVTPDQESEGIFFLNILLRIYQDWITNYKNLDWLCFFINCIILYTHIHLYVMYLLLASMGTLNRT